MRKFRPSLLFFLSALLCYSSIALTQESIAQYLKPMFLNCPIDSGYRDVFTFYKAYPNVNHTRLHGRFGINNSPGELYQMYIDRFSYTKPNTLTSLFGNDRAYIEIRSTEKNELASISLTLEYLVDKTGIENFELLVQKIKEKGIILQVNDSKDKQRKDFAFYYYTERSQLLVQGLTGHKVDNHHFYIQVSLMNMSRVKVVL
jgi:hypothetical protein